MNGIATRGQTQVMRAVMFLVLAAGVGACDRTYLTPSHGRAYRQAFSVQTAYPDRQADEQAVHGLDSQEAAIISSSYRKALAPKDEGSSNQQQLLTVSPRGSREGNMPAPSVPSGQ